MKIDQQFDIFARVAQVCELQPDMFVNSHQGGQVI